jgi:uncharacterized membrane protein (Fun14 family)
MALIDNPLFMKVMCDIGFGLIVGSAVGYSIDRYNRDTWAIGGAVLMLTLDFGRDYVDPSILTTQKITEYQQEPM